MFQRVYIEITNICNLSCSFCLKHNRIPQTMALHEFTHILNEISGYTKHVYFHVQGEPFLHPELISFMDDCYLKGFKVHLVTNGTLLNRMDISLYTHPALVQLSVSLHSSQIEINDDNFIVLKKLIETVDSLKVSLFLRLWTFKDNNLINLLNSLIQPNTVQLEGKRIRIKRNLFVDLDDEFEWPNLNQTFQSNSGICHAGTKMMAILSNGDVSPCCLDANGIIDLGNIHQIGFKQIVNSEKYLNIIKGFERGLCVEQLCQGCTYRLRFNKKGSTFSI